ncbi:MAG: peptidoglycan editing factor PgeF [Pseudoflavonifractor sp.]
MNFAEKTVGDLCFGYVPELGAIHGFSTRMGGVSQGVYASLNLGLSLGDERGNVQENYRRFCAAVGVDKEKLVFSGQEHGPLLRCCTLADAGNGLLRPVDYQADGLITDVPGLALTIFTADCLPILLSDPVRKVVAAVHAGWRGTASGIAAKAVGCMRTIYGCNPKDIRVAIGPGISKCCFETHEDVPNHMTESMCALPLPYIEVCEAGKFHVDLKGLNAADLEQNGVLPEHIAISPDCTACMPEKYWSHRVTRGERGSMAAVIALEG